MKTVDLSGKPFHFIGIGGIGMSALAYVIAKRQLPVSGSDLRTSHITERLKSVGAHIFNQQTASNLQFFQPSSAAIGDSSSTTSTLSVAAAEALPQVVCSTAIAPNNPEYQAAKSLNCEILHRSDLLAALIKDYRSIAVAGTHGKTTTSSLIGFMLVRAGVDPTIIVGGEVDEWDGNARLGGGKWLVAEADESDGSLVKHAPAVGIITNIELDHPDHYQSLEAVVKTFKTFAAQCQTVIGCIDDPLVEEQIKPQISYSIESSQPADYQVGQVNYSSQWTEAQVWERGQPLGTIRLSILGKHNLSNALAAVAVGRLVGLSMEQIAAALAEFRGTKRRFEVKGTRNGIVLVDDYAHHPTEIRVTLAAARQRLQENPQLHRVVAVFQPHRYSRTHRFLAEFASAFTDADRVIITDIYSAGEKNLWPISGQHVAAAIAKQHPSASFQAIDCLSEFLANSILKPGDLTLFLGAGNLNQTIPQVIEQLP